MSIAVTTAVRSIIAGMVATAASLYAPDAAAQAVNQINLPVQSLAESLKAVGSLTNTNIMAPQRLVDGVNAPAVNGEMTADAVFARLLDGTGLEYHFVNDRTVVIRRKMESADPRAQNGRHGADAFRLAQAEDAAGAQPDDALQEVVVTGINFKYNDVESANKMNLSIKDTPQTVKVITEDMLDFAGVTKFEDTYKIDAGAQTSNAQDGWVRTYFRGFRLDYDKALKVDGLRIPGYVTPDLAGFERFEIVKGPTSTMFGQAQIAGTLNAVSKKPRAERGGSISLETGSFNHYLGEVDVYGALTADERLTARLVASYLDEDTFLDFGFNERKVIAPSVKYDFTRNTALTVQLQYQEGKFNGSYGYGAQYTGSVGTATEALERADPRNYDWPDVPRSRLVGFQDAIPERELFLARTLLEHSFSNDWKLRAIAQYAKTDVVNLGAYSGPIEPDGETPLYMYFTEGGGDAYAGDVSLFGNVELFGREHTLYAGIEYSRDDFGRLTGFGLLGPGSFNIYSPDYSALPSLPRAAAPYLDLGTPGYGGGIYQDHSLYEEKGAVLQAILHPVDRLSVLLGARYSSFDVSYRSACCDETALEPLPSGFAGIAGYSDDDLTFQFGTTYALTPGINAYLSYGETFLPRNQFVANPDAPDDPEQAIRTPPEAGVSYEVGLKGEAFERQLSWSVATFDIRRENIAEDAPGENPLGFVVLQGEQRARGVEVDFQGEVRPGWDVYGSLAVINNKFVKGDLTGFRSFVAPKFGASFFSSYEIQQGPLAGLGFGGGLIYKDRGEVRQFQGGPLSGDPEEDLTNNFGRFFDHLFDDTFEIDARVFYRREAWTFQVAAMNLLDTKYYMPVNSNFSGAVSVNPPRMVFGKISYDFGT
jgi:iron complex outermembrane receptor protein